jgi:hypothetical protein
MLLSHWVCQKIECTDKNYVISCEVQHRKMRRSPDPLSDDSDKFLMRETFGFDQKFDVRDIIRV